MRGASPNCGGEKEGQVGLAQSSLFLSVHQTVIRRQTSGAKTFEAALVHPAHQAFLDRSNRLMIVNRGNYVCMSGQEQNGGHTGRGEYYFNVARVARNGVGGPVAGKGWGAGSAAGHVARDPTRTRLGRNSPVWGNASVEIHSRKYSHRPRCNASNKFPLYPSTRNRSFLAKLSRKIIQIYIHILYIRIFDQLDAYIYISFRKEIQSGNNYFLHI